MPNYNLLIKTIDVIIENTNDLNDADKQELIILKQKILSGSNLNATEVENIQDSVKRIAVKYYHDLDELEKLLPSQKPPPRTAS